MDINRSTLSINHTGSDSLSSRRAGRNGNTPFRAMNQENSRDSGIRVKTGVRFISDDTKDVSEARNTVGVSPELHDAFRRYITALSEAETNEDRFSATQTFSQERRELSGLPEVIILSGQENCPEDAHYLELMKNQAMQLAALKERYRNVFYELGVDWARPPEEWGLDDVERLSGLEEFMELIDNRDKNTNLGSDFKKLLDVSSTEKKLIDIFV